MRTWLSKISQSFPSFAGRLAAVAGMFCAVAVLCAQSDSKDDPLSIVRIAIPAERVGKELEKVQQGTLTLQPLEEFEARVKLARKQLANREQKPRLRGAHYRAELVGHQLTHGSGQWHIHHHLADAALLPISPFNLALHKMKWERGADAAFAEFDGKSLSLLVPGADYRTCFFDWSMRGTLTPDGIQFPIGVPPCASCEFELLIPTEYWLTVAKSTALVTGPIETETPTKRLWRIQASGLSQFTVTLRRIADTGAVGTAAPTLFSRVHATQSVEPRRVSIDQEFHVDIVHGSIQELTLEGDPRLQPYEVTFKGGQLKRWQWREGLIAPKDPKDAKGKPGKDVPGSLTLQFDQPMHGKLEALRIRCIAAAPANETWSSPGLRLAGAFSRGETLTIRVHPILPAARWHTGSFDTTNVSAEADGTQVVTLVETLASAGASRRPTILFHANPVELTTESRCRWDLTDAYAVLQTEIRCVASHGSLYELRAVLPKTNPVYALEQVNVQPEGMMRGWYITGETLVVELKQPLTPAREATLTARLRTRYLSNLGTSRVLSYPEMDLINSTRRTGRLDVFVDNSAYAQLMASSLPLTTSVAEAEREPLASYSFHWRNQKLTAAIRVTPKPGQIGVRGEHRIALQGTKATTRFGWEIEPLAGSPQHVDFRFSPGFPSEWRIGGDEGKSPIHRMEKLPMAEALPHLLSFGAANPVMDLATRAIVPSGPIWRFHFSEQLRGKTKFSVETATEAGTDGGNEPAALHPDLRVWELPAMMPLGVAEVEQIVAIDSVDEAIHRLDGPQSMPQDANTAKTPFGIRLRNSEMPRRVWTQRNLIARSSVEVCDEAECLTKIYRDGRVYHQVSFRIRGRRTPTCELRLPESMRVVAVRVQDRWLGHFRAQNDADAVRLTLPCDDSATATRYVIVTQSPTPGFLAPGMTRMTLPSIGWPVAPIDARMRLAVEEGITPLFRDDREPIGTPQGLNPKSEWIRRTQPIWTWGDSWLRSASGGSAAEKIDQVRSTALLAEARLHADPGEPFTLGALLERYALVELKDKLPVVIDRLAFKELDLDPQTAIDPKMLRAPIDRPFWETLGLVFVPTPHGMLLTTAARMHLLGVTSASQIESISPAMREVILGGRDASGGFSLVTTWLNQAAVTSPEWHGPADSKLTMREWDLSLPSDNVAITLLDRSVAHSLGWVLAMLVGLAFYATRSRYAIRIRVRALIFLLTGMIVAIVFCPAAISGTILFPVALSFAVALIAAVVEASRLPAASMETASAVKPGKAAGTVAATLLIGVFAWQCYAQPVAAVRSYTVWIIQSPKPAVLIPAELSARLSEIEKQAGFASQPVAVLGARYVGQVIENRARFEVDYEVLCVRPTTNFVIPLSGVQLEEGSLLDGTPSFPSANKNGYALAIRKAGVHHIRLSFTAPIDNTDGVRIVRFSAPKTPRSDVRMQWSSPVQNPQLARGMGEEKIVAGSPSSVRSWQAQIGHESDIHLRWTGGPTAPTTKGMDVSEAHYWDLRPGNKSLSSQLHYRLGSASLGQLTVAVPEGLQVQSIEAHGVVLAGTLSLPITIKQWQVQGKAAQRRLVVDFAKPVSGELVVRLDALPTEFTTQRWMLNLPSPMQGKSTEGWLAYRLEATESGGAAQNLAVQSMTTDEFQKNWQRLGGVKSAAPTRAYRFQRKANVAGLELFIQLREFKAHCDLVWTIDATGADLRANCTLASPVGDICLAEFLVDPGIVLAGVRGPDVHRWHQHETLLQVWLKQPRKQTTIEITGWQAYSKKATKKAHTVPPIHPLHAQLVDSSIALRLAPGLDVDVVNQRSLRRDAKTPLHFAITAWPWDLAYQIRRQKVVPSATARAKVERTERGLDWSQELQFRSDRGSLPTLLIKIAGVPANGVKLDVPGGIASALPSKKAGESAWRVQFTDGLPASVIATLSARLPGTGVPVLPMPVVEVAGVEVVRSTVAWKDVDIIDSKSGKLISESRPNGDGIAPAGALPLWKAAPVRSALEIAARPTPITPAVKILTYSEMISRTSNGDWMHEASCWVQAMHLTDLRLRFPLVVESLHVAIDGTTHLTLATNEKTRTLTMKLSEQSQHLIMRWKYKPGAENPTTPNAEPVQIGDAPLPTGGRVLLLPRDATVRDRGHEDTAMVLHALLRDAESEVRLMETSIQLTPTGSSGAHHQIAQRQHRLVKILRQASYLNGIAHFAHPAHDAAEFQQRIARLKNRNVELAKRNGWDKQRVQYEKAASLQSCAIPIIDTVRPGSLIAVHSGQTMVPLISQADVSVGYRWGKVEFALLAALVLLTLSYFRQTYTVLRLAAPELTAAMLLIAMAWFGVGLLPMALTLILIGVRVVWTINFARVRLLPVRKPTRSTEQASTRTLPPTVN